MILRRAAVAAFSRGANLQATHAARFTPRSRIFASQQQSWMSTVTVPDAPTSNHLHIKLKGAKGKMIYTETDEAPALATYSLYPVVAKVRYVS
jgi:hypothetical protein